jgi:hypothetical protein
VAIILSDDGGTANSGVNSSQQIFTIQVTAVNDPPTFDVGEDVVVLEDAAAVASADFITNLSENSVDGLLSATVSSVTNNNNALFLSQPAIDMNGQLTFTSAVNANGSAVVSVTVQDAGGTDNGGNDTTVKTFTIFVTAVNDTPSFTKGADQSVNPQAGAVSVANWATNLSTGPGDESAQTLTFLVAAANTALFTSQPAVSANGTLTYTPKFGQSGSTSITIAVQDDGLTANGGVDTSADQSFTITLVQGPIITQHPSNLLVEHGASAVFSLTAVGVPTPTYQWQSRTGVLAWQNIDGETSDSFTIPTTDETIDHAKQIRCVVTNDVGSVTSNVAILSVGRSPVIDTQPVASSVSIGGMASFSVEGSGSPALSYQWQRSTTVGGNTFAAIINATNTTYTLSPVASGDDGFVYRCVVTNALGEVTSEEVALTVTVVPVTITVQPLARSVVAGQTAIFSVVAAGSPTLTYEWQRSDDAGMNYNPIGGAVSASYSTPTTTVIDDDGDRYRCVVTNDAGFVNSSEVILSVSASATAPVITVPTIPTVLDVLAGDVVVVSVTASGVPTPTYQWRRNGLIINGATAASYAFTANMVDNNAAYICTVANSAGSAVSPRQTLNVSPSLPSVTIAASATAVTIGSTVTFTATTSGEPVPTLAWFKDGVAIGGAVGAAYQLVTTSNDFGKPFTCVATNGHSGGAVTSAPISLTIVGLA